MSTESTGERVKLDARGWPILRSSGERAPAPEPDARGTAWERHDDPAVEQ